MINNNNIITIHPIIKTLIKKIIEILKKKIKITETLNKKIITIIQIRK